MKGQTLRNDFLRLLYNATTPSSLWGRDAAAPIANISVALHTAWPSGAATQATSQCAYLNYVQKTVARTTGGWTVTANSVSPVAEIEFAEAGAGASESAGFFSTGDGTIIFHRGVIGGYAPVVVTGATSDTITAPGHGLSVSDKVVFFSPFGLALPTGITEGTIYFVKTAPTADTITISTTDGGATLDITASGVGYVQRCKPIAITEGVRPILKTTSAIVEY